MTVETTPGYRIPRIGWGARLRAIREDIADMDQRDFADSIGMNHGTYGGHEKRVEVPRSARLIANSIELRWRVPAAWVLTGEIPRPRTGTDSAGVTIWSRRTVPSIPNAHLASVIPIRPRQAGTARVGMPAAVAG